LIIKLQGEEEGNFLERRARLEEIRHQINEKKLLPKNPSNPMFLRLNSGIWLTSPGCLVHVFREADTFFIGLLGRGVNRYNSVRLFSLKWRPYKGAIDDERVKGLLGTTFKYLQRRRYIVMNKPKDFSTSAKLMVQGQRTRSMGVGV